jgi:hypothetical protein
VTARLVVRVFWAVARPIRMAAWSIRAVARHIRAVVGQLSR